MIRGRILENSELPAGVSWLLQVIDHEAVLMDPKFKIVLKLGSQVSGVVETGVWTADKQPVALLAKN
jgi:hypothetical protein